MFPKIVLKPGKDRSVRLFHPWIFSGAVAYVDEGINEGDITEVYSHDKKYLGTGHFHHGSIKVRLFSFEKTSFERDFWIRRLGGAIELRKSLSLVGNEETTMYRLVHAEGDSLPGLIIDIYGSNAVIQAHTIGMHRAVSEIANSLSDITELSLDTIFDKSEDAMKRQSGIETVNSFLKGSSKDAIVKENGINFYVNWEEGQKTGFFIDQRENRNLLRRYVRDKKVLNTFSYSGGFSMNALRHGAKLVHSVDSSLRAMSWAQRNSELNSVNERHEFFQNDVFDFLKSSNSFYDVIVLDPPAFAKHLSAEKKAIVGYRNLNTAGIKHVAPGGIIFTFSCSQVIDKELFRKIVFQSASQAGRNVRILHQLSQAPDHPVSIWHPEGEYLKGLVLYVE
jgi:23S rRNA (cytosine1962-C5)-methyltransferase